MLITEASIFYKYFLNKIFTNTSKFIHNMNINKGQNMNILRREEIINKKYKTLLILQTLFIK